MRIIIALLTPLVALFFLPQASNASVVAPTSTISVTTMTMLVSGQPGKGNAGKGRSGKNGAPSHKKKGSSGAPSRAKRFGETKKRSGSRSATKQPSADKKANNSAKKRQAGEYRAIASNSGKGTREIGIQAGRPQLTKGRSNKSSSRKLRRTRGAGQAIVGTSGKSSRPRKTDHKSSTARKRANASKKNARAKEGKKTPSPTAANLNTASTSAPGPSKEMRDRKGKGRKFGGVKRLSTQSAGRPVSEMLSRAPNTDKPI